MSRENILDDRQAKLIAKELFKNGIYYFGKGSGLYGTIQKMASDLGIIEYKDGIESGRTFILNNEDYLKVTDEIWQYIIEGYFAPGKNINNPWFPNIHITEKGKKHLEKLNQEDEEDTQI